MDKHPERDPTILIVDDEPFIVDELASLLEGEGYCVVTASSSRLALSIVACFQSLRLVLTDMLMPGQSGTKLIEQLGNRGLSFVLTSGHLEANALALPNTIFMRKPIDINALLDAVAVAHQQ